MTTTGPSLETGSTHRPSSPDTLAGACVWRQSRRSGRSGGRSGGGVAVVMVMTTTYRCSLVELIGRPNHGIACSSSSSLYCGARWRRITSCAPQATPTRAPQRSGTRDRVRTPITARTMRASRRLEHLIVVARSHERCVLFSVAVHASVASPHCSHPERCGEHVPPVARQIMSCSSRYVRSSAAGPRAAAYAGRFRQRAFAPGTASQRGHSLRARALLEVTSDTFEDEVVKVRTRPGPQPHGETGAGHNHRLA